MLKANVVIGEVYLAKVSGRLSPVRIDSESQYGGWNGTNLRTNASVRIRGGQRLRARLEHVEGHGTPRGGKWRIVREEGSLQALDPDRHAKNTCRAQ